MLVSTHAYAVALVIGTDFRVVWPPLLTASPGEKLPARV
jgi:hypothetical protein